MDPVRRPAFDRAGSRIIAILRVIFHTPHNLNFVLSKTASLGDWLNLGACAIAPFSDTQDAEIGGQLKSVGWPIIHSDLSNGNCSHAAFCLPRVLVIGDFAGHRRCQVADTFVLFCARGNERD